MQIQVFRHRRRASLPNPRAGFARSRCCKSAWPGGPIAPAFCRGIWTSESTSRFTKWPNAGSPPRAFANARGEAA